VGVNRSSGSGATFTTAATLRRGSLLIFLYAAISSHIDGGIRLKFFQTILTAEVNRSLLDFKMERGFRRIDFHSADRVFNHVRFAGDRQCDQGGGK
jgi:hypothetical protein